MKTLKIMSSILGILAIIGGVYYEMKKVDKNLDEFKKVNNSTIVELALIGKFNQLDDSGYEEYTIQFFSNGNFTQEEYLDINKTLIYKGKWHVKDSYLYSIVDLSTIEVYPEDEYLKERCVEIIKKGNEENKPSKIISYDESQVIYEYEGKRYTMYKITSE